MTQTRCDRGSRRPGDAGFAYLCEFVEEMKATGFVVQRIAAHGVVGLTVAPPAAS